MKKIDNKEEILDGYVIIAKNEEGIEKTFKNKKFSLKKLTAALLILSMTLVLSSCGTEIATNSHVEYTTIDTSNDTFAKKGKEQVLDVEGENFKLVVGYRPELAANERWTITANKDIVIYAKTKGLNPDTKVYIDNVHTDVVIQSYLNAMTGVTQDTMDDRIHNAQMLGFPISDTNTYSNNMVIEGENKEFQEITMTSFYGTGYYSSSTGTITNKRYVESDYLKNGVYGNLIASTFDLIILRPDGEITCKSVTSKVSVTVWPYVEYRKGNGETFYRYYQYNKITGKIEEHSLSLEEYYNIIGKNSISALPTSNNNYVVVASRPLKRIRRINS